MLSNSRPPSTPSESSSNSPASAVVVHGFWSEKYVREKSRLIPWNGNDSAHQSIASATRSVAAASNSPRS